MAALRTEDGLRTGRWERPQGPREGSQSTALRSAASPRWPDSAAFNTQAAPSARSAKSRSPRARCASARRTTTAATCKCSFATLTASRQHVIRGQLRALSSLVLAVQPSLRPGILARVSARRGSAVAPAPAVARFFENTAWITHRARREAHSLQSKCRAKESYMYVHVHVTCDMCMCVYFPTFHRSRRQQESSRRSTVGMRWATKPRSRRSSTLSCRVLRPFLPPSTTWWPRLGCMRTSTE